MGKSLLRQVVDEMPGEERRYVWKQAEVATCIWKIMSRKVPAWTQRDLARAAGLKESYISHLLSGAGNPTLKTLCKLEDALGEEILLSALSVSRNYKSGPEHGTAAPVKSKRKGRVTVP